MLVTSLTFLVSYFSIDNWHIIYTKKTKFVEMNIRGIQVKGMGGKSNVKWKYYLIFIEH
jgi:hypothetical protein